MYLKKRKATIRTSTKPPIAPIAMPAIAPGLSLLLELLPLWGFEFAASVATAVSDDFAAVWDTADDDGGGLDRVGDDDELACVGNGGEFACVGAGDESDAVCDADHAKVLQSCFSLSSSSASH